MTLKVQSMSTLIGLQEAVIITPEAEEGATD